MSTPRAAIQNRDPEYGDPPGTVEFQMATAEGLKWVALRSHKQVAPCFFYGADVNSMYLFLGWRKLGLLPLGCEPHYDRDV
jgi:hypothetical protein